MVNAGRNMTSRLILRFRPQHPPDRNRYPRMKIFELTCEDCSAIYRVAESDCEPGKPGELRCAICSHLIASWQEPKLRVAKLTAEPERAAFHVPSPAAPLI